MFKTIALLKAKPGMSRSAFIEYYETRHAPLILECMPQIREYRRNFIDLDGAIIESGATAPDFDVITEMWYADRAAYEAAMANYARPEISSRIIRDEENFLDRSKTRFFAVDECRSNI